MVEFVKEIEESCRYAFTSVGLVLRRGAEERSLDMETEILGQIRYLQVSLKG